MKRPFLVLLAVCTLTAAMVLRERRALNSEDEDVHRNGSDLHTICADQTPCQWIMYNNGYASLTIPNSYCECDKSKNCIYTENNTNSNSYVFHCRTPSVEVGESSDSENS